MYLLNGLNVQQAFAISTTDIKIFSMSDKTPFPIVSNIVAEAGEQVLYLFDKHPNNRLVFHNYAFTQTVLQHTRTLCEETGATGEVAEIAQLAAYYLFTGYLLDYDAFLRCSLDQAQRFLALRDYSENGQRSVLRCMQTVGTNNIPAALEEKIVSDAVSAAWIEDFEARSPLLRLEREMVQGKTFTKQEWTALQLQQLLNIRFYTHFGKTKYEPKLGHCIRDQKRALEKMERDNPPVPMAAQEGLFQNLDESPIRAVQTFFRTNYRNHINLSSIADNKAHIMISVNSILISVLISILSYRNMAETNPQIVLPVILFLVTGLTSLIFAVLCARPKVTALNETLTDKVQRRKNIVFFGNFVNMDLEEYEEAMDAMFRDGELLYGNLTRDLYFLGKVLDKKYRYLTVSYNIFMIGFAATVITFLIMLFI